MTPDKPIASGPVAAIIAEMLAGQEKGAEALRAGLWRESLAAGALKLAELMAQLEADLTADDRAGLIAIGAGLFFGDRQLNNKLS